MLWLIYLYIYFENNITWHRQALMKNCNKVYLLDDEPLKNAFPGSWALIVDKGYQGLTDTLRVIHTQKKPRGNCLCSQEKHANDMISRDTDIVEN